MSGVLYDGLHILGAGAILTGLVLAAIAVFVIERKFEMAAAFAAAGAVLTFFGFMHGEAVGVERDAVGGARRQYELEPSRRHCHI